MTQFCDITLG